MKEFWKSYNIKNAILNVADASHDLQVSNFKNGWNKFWSEANGKLI